MPKPASKKSKSRAVKRAGIPARPKIAMPAPLRVLAAEPARSILVRDIHSARAASKGAKAARERLREIELQCVAMELSWFFARHPEISQVEFDADFQGFGAGDEDCWLSYRFGFVAGTPEARAKADYDDGGDGAPALDYDARLLPALEDELDQIFQDDDVKVAVGRLKVQRDEATTKFARRVMGKDAHERWRASLEQAEIEEAAGPATAASDPVRL